MNITKLEAVNDVMRRIGKLPITALDTGGDSTEGHVEREIDEVVRKMQSNGWMWNTKYDVEVTPDSSTNKVQVNELEGVSVEIYSVDTDAESAGVNVMRAGNFLYDLEKNQDTFEDYSTLKLRYVYERAFTEIPDQFITWIIATSAFNYNRQYIKDQTIDQRLIAEMGVTKVDAMREELRVADVNVLNTEDMHQIRGRPRMWNRSIY